MYGLMIAHTDSTFRDALAARLDDAYRITHTDALANALEPVLEGDVQVVVLGGCEDEGRITRLIPLLKTCNKHIAIILVSESMPVELVKAIRREGVFYHALKPTDDQDLDEIVTAVHCAFDRYHELTRSKKRKGILMSKTALSALALMLVASPAFAVDTAKTYTSGLLALAFVGLCGLIVVAQLLPALKSLFGITRDAAENSREKSAVKSHN